MPDSRVDLAFPPLPVKTGLSVRYGERPANRLRNISNSRKISRFEAYITGDTDDLATTPRGLHATFQLSAIPQAMPPTVRQEPVLPARPDDDPAATPEASRPLFGSSRIFNPYGGLIAPGMPLNAGFFDLHFSSSPRNKPAIYRKSNGDSSMPFDGDPIKKRGFFSRLKSWAARLGEKSPLFAAPPALVRAPEMANANPFAEPTDTPNEIFIWKNHEPAIRPYASALERDVPTIEGSTGQDPAIGAEIAAFLDDAPFPKPHGPFDLVEHIPYAEPDAGKRLRQTLDFLDGLEPATIAGRAAVAADVAPIAVPPVKNEPDIDATVKLPREALLPEIAPLSLAEALALPTVEPLTTFVREIIESSEFLHLKTPTIEPTPALADGEPTMFFANATEKPAPLELPYPIPAMDEPAADDLLSPEHTIPEIFFVPEVDQPLEAAEVVKANDVAAFTAVTLENDETIAITDLSIDTGDFPAAASVATEPAASEIPENVYSAGGITTVYPPESSAGLVEKVSKSDGITMIQWVRPAEAIITLAAPTTRIERQPEYLDSERTRRDKITKALKMWCDYQEGETGANTAKKLLQHLEEMPDCLRMIDMAMSKWERKREKFLENPLYSGIPLPAEGYETEFRDLVSEIGAMRHLTTMKNLPDYASLTDVCQVVPSRVFEAPALA